MHRKTKFPREGKSKIPKGWQLKIPREWKIKIPTFCGIEFTLQIGCNPLGFNKKIKKPEGDSMIRNGSLKVKFWLPNSSWMLFIEMKHIFFAFFLKKFEK